MDRVWRLLFYLCAAAAFAGLPLVLMDAGERISLRRLFGIMTLLAVIFGGLALAMRE
jgi:hypothetical protein